MWVPKVGDLVAIPESRDRTPGTITKSSYGIVVDSSASGNYIEVFYENDLKIMDSTEVIPVGKEGKLWPLRNGRSVT